MHSKHKVITFREFAASDAPFCFRVRCRAFVLQFTSELSLVEIAAGICAFVPEDYVQMTERMDLFIVEEADQAVGFFSLKRIDDETAEIPLLYLDRPAQGRGIGGLCIQFIEDRITRCWASVETLFVDTIVPGVNGGFYKSVGFMDSGSVVCRYPDLSLEARRLTKRLPHPASE
jgi:GNAT superfamily N-acetyltransferase